MSIPTLEMTSGYQVPQLGLGTWRLWGEECVRVTKLALQMGYRHIDTADLYENHAEVGRAIADFDRSQLFLTSKVHTQDLHRQDVIRVCNSALQDLHTDYIDLFLIHWPNFSIPLEETFSALEQLAGQGKFRSVGVSNFNVALLEDSLRDTNLPISNNQIEFHPLLYQPTLLNFCHRQDITVTAYCPLARGRALENGVIADLATNYSRTRSQICLRWLIQKGAIVIPKASSEAHLRENMEIFNWDITSEDEQRIDEIEQRHRVVPLDFEF